MIKWDYTHLKSSKSVKQMNTFEGFELVEAGW